MDSFCSLNDHMKIKKRGEIPSFHKLYRLIAIPMEEHITEIMFLECTRFDVEIRKSIINPFHMNLWEKYHR